MHTSPAAVIPTRSPASRIVGAGAWPVAIAAGFGQACTLATCAVLALWTPGSAPVVLHRVGPGYDVAAWWTPARGMMGAVTNGAVAASIVAAIVLGFLPGRTLAVIGRSALAAWGAFFAWRFGVVALTTRDGVDLGLFGLCLVVVACQLVSIRRVMRRARAG